MTPSLESPSARTDARERPLAWLYAFLFLAAIGLPALELFTGRVDAGVSREMRRTRPRPRLALDPERLEHFPEEFERWYANHFALRTELLRQHNYAKYFALATSPTDKAVVGRDDWLFYADSGVLEQVRGALPFAPGEVEAWVELLEERSDWLARHGCRYVFVLAPSKARIYPEHLPPGYGAVGASRFDELRAALEPTRVGFVDLRQGLREERANDRDGDLLYYPFGTHWTRRAGLRAAREIARALPGLLREPPPLEAFERVPEPRSQGDTWSGRLYLDGWLQQEDWIPRLPGGARLEHLGPASDHSVRFSIDGPAGEGLPRGVLYHDSFGTALRPFLARCCRELECRNKGEWNLAQLEAAPPDFVVELLTERKLVTLSPHVLALQTPERLAEGFEASDENLWSTAQVERALASGPGDEAGDDAGRSPARRVLGGAPGLVVSLPPLPDALEGDAILAVDVEAREACVLDLHLMPGSGPVRGGPAFSAYARPGAGTLYFRVRLTPGFSQVALASETPGWTVRAARARRVRAREDAEASESDEPGP